MKIAFGMIVLNGNYVLEEYMVRLISVREKYKLELKESIQNE